MRAGSASVAPASMSSRARSARCSASSSASWHLVVDAEHLGYRRRNQRRDLHLVLHRHGDDVGEVVLALRIGILAASPSHRRSSLAGTAMMPLLPSRILSCALAGILLFDDFLDGAARVADDAAITRRIVEHHGQQGHGLRAGERDELPQGSRRRSAAHRRTAPAPRSSSAMAGIACMRACPVPSCSACSAHSSCSSASAARTAVTAVAVHHVDRGGIEAPRAADDMAQQWLRRRAAAEPWGDRTSFACPDRQRG